MRLSSLTDAQYATILQLAEIAGKPVTVTRPWCVDRLQKTLDKNAAEAQINMTRDSVSNRDVIGIAFGLPLDAADDEIRSDNNCNWIRSFPIKPNATSKTVICAFNDKLPNIIAVHKFLRFKLSPYVPRPMRCTHCGAFGHLASACKNTAVCDHCAVKGHSAEACTSIEDTTKIKCINCRGKHRSSDKACPRYVTNCKILELAHKSTPPLPFRQAQALWVKAQNDQRDKPESGRTAPVSETAPGAEVIKLTYAQAISANKRERNNRRSAEAAASAPVAADPIGLRKADIEVIVTSLAMLNLIACAVLQEEPASESKLRTKDIVQTLHQQLVNILIIDTTYSPELCTKCVPKWATF